MFKIILSINYVIHFMVELSVQVIMEESSYDSNMQMRLSSPILHYFC